MSIQEFKDIVIELLRCEIETEDEQKIVFKRTEFKFSLEKSLYAAVSESLRLMNSIDEIELSSSNSYETLVRHDSRVYLRRETPNLVDPVNKINYFVGRPSDEYLLFFLSKLKNFTQLPIRRIIDPFRFRRFRERQREMGDQGTGAFQIVG